jgi:hypothetical protein
VALGISQPVAATGTDTSPSPSVSPSVSESPSVPPSPSPSPSVTPSETPTPGAEGCTPGYWKTHPESWPISTTTTLGEVFTGTGIYSGTTLLAALSFQGGTGLDGATRILLRAAVAAYLNSLSVDYAFTTAQVVTMVNTALASGDRDVILATAAQLDAANNGTCPLD